MATCIQEWLHQPCPAQFLGLEQGISCLWQEAGYDVYVNEPQMLPEGQDKHLISIFVADESGMINRVAGVFARRGDPLPCLGPIHPSELFIDSL